jgi:hypothetical protein
MENKLFRARRIDDCINLMLPPKKYFSIWDWLNRYREFIISNEFMVPDPIKLGEEICKADPFDESLLVKDRHFLFYLPEDLNLTKLERLCSRDGGKTHFRACMEQLNQDCWYKNKKFTEEKGSGNWLLALLSPIPQSFGKKHEEAKKLVPAGYQIPVALEATTAHILYGLKNNCQLNPTCVGRTSSVDGQERITVGRMSHQGLLIGKVEDDEEDLDTGLLIIKRIPQVKEQIS